MFNRAQLQQIWNPVADIFKNVSAEAMAWAAIVVMHLSTVPTLLAMMSGLSMDHPPADYVLMVWLALILFLLRAAIKRDVVQMVTIGIGFAVQASMLVLLFFK
jgi:predicted butyrate kinase (DUF1464 family)